MVLFLQRTISREMDMPIENNIDTLIERLAIRCDGYLLSDDEKIGEVLLNLLLYLKDNFEPSQKKESL